MDNEVRAGAHADRELRGSGKPSGRGKERQAFRRVGAQAQGPSRPGCTYTQVPGVQLHLLLQLREQLVVKRLQLDMERKHTSRQLQHMDPEQEAAQG